MLFQILFVVASVSAILAGRYYSVSGLYTQGQGAEAEEYDYR